MGKFSRLGAINNKIENNNKLCFAKENLSVEQFDKLYKSYRQLFWFQIAPVIVFIVIIIFMLIFIPSDYSNLKSGIILLGIAFFVVPFFPIWLIISQFTAGKLWHKYSKWYKREGSMNELYELFK